MNDLSVKRNAHPGLWREGILIEDNYIHDVESEGMYVGPNYQDGDLPLRNIEIRNNRVEDIGWDGINTKSMWAGDNSIHHNDVRRAGKNSSRLEQASSVLGNQEQLGNRQDLQQLDRDDRPARHSGVDAGRPEDVRGIAARSKRISGTTSSWTRADCGARSCKESWHQCRRPGRLREAGSAIYNNTIVNSRRARSSWPAMSARDSCVTISWRGPAAIRPLSFPVSSTDQQSCRHGLADGVRGPGSRNFRLRSAVPRGTRAPTSFRRTTMTTCRGPRKARRDQGAFEGSGT